MIIMDVSVKEDDENHARHQQGASEGVVQQVGGDDVGEAQDVEQQKEHKEVEQYHHPRGGDFVDDRGEGNGQFLHADNDAKYHGNNE